jgi:hypothetical protein
MAFQKVSKQLRDSPQPRILRQLPQHQLQLLPLHLKPSLLPARPTPTNQSISSQQQQPRTKVATAVEQDEGQQLVQVQVLEQVSQQLVQLRVVVREPITSTSCARVRISSSFASSCSSRLPCLSRFCNKLLKGTRSLLR